MGWRDRLREVDARLKKSPILYRVKEGLDLLLVPVLLLLVAVLYLEFFAHLSHTAHEYVLLAEKGILVYFIAELGVDFLIYEERKAFFRDRWVDILLVMPFFLAFRTVNAALRALRGLKLLKPTKSVKTVKAVKTAKSLNAIKTAETARIGPAVKGSQKTAKLVTKLRHIRDHLSR